MHKVFKVCRWKSASKQLLKVYNLFLDIIYNYEK